MEPLILSLPVNTDTLTKKEANSNAITLIEQQLLENLHQKALSNKALAAILDNLSPLFLERTFIPWLIQNSERIISSPLADNDINTLLMCAVLQENAEIVATIVTLAPNPQRLYIESALWVYPLVALIMQKRIKKHLASKSPGLKKLFTLALTRPDYRLPVRGDLADYLAHPKIFVAKYITYHQTHNKLLCCSDGQTPLMWSAIFGHTRLAKHLIDNEVNPINTKDIHNKTALDYAKEHNRNKIITMIKKKLRSHIATNLLSKAIENSDESSIISYLKNGAQVSDRLFLAALKCCNDQHLGLLFLRWKGDI